MDVCGSSLAKLKRKTIAVIIPTEPGDTFRVDLFPMNDGYKLHTVNVSCIKWNQFVITCIVVRTSRRTRTDREKKVKKQLTPIYVFGILFTKCAGVH